MMLSMPSRGLFSLGLASAALIASVASPASAQALDEIVARHMAARGGAERWQTVRSVRMTGRAIAGPGREALVTREIKRPSRVRTEFTFQGITGVYAYDGQRGWQLSPLTGIVEPQALEPENTLAALEQADMEGPLVGAQKKGSSLALIGRETVSGREAFHIRVTPKTGAPQDQFLDVETFLLVRTESTREVRGRAVRIETTFGDYRTVGGLVVPHMLEIGARGRPERVRISVEAVELNPQIDDGRFRAPAGTRR
jgi:outer membrane lipoprotein-sorting protein